jgi:hypothetical protein
MESKLWIHKKITDNNQKWYNLKNLENLILESHLQLVVLHVKRTTRKS